MKEILKEAYERFIKYEMDVDSEAPYDHKDFMERLKSCINDVSTTENIEKHNDCNTYRKYEFCKAMNCLWLRDGKCLATETLCTLTAKQFHHWLTDHKFEIISKNKD